MMCLLIAGLLIVIGLIFKLFPPKKINSFYGYRTVTSMKNQTIWDYAQKIGALSFIIEGFFLGTIGLILWFLNINNEIFEMSIFLISMIAMLIIDELIIKKH